MADDRIDMGRSIWLDRIRCTCCTRCTCCACGGGLCLREDFGGEGGGGFGGYGACIGRASPISVCPRAFSTSGLLKRLKRDILDGARSSFAAGLGVVDFAEEGMGAGDRTGAGDLFRRQREDECS